MRKIHVIVLETFGTREEAAAFRSELTSRLRSEHAAAIVQVDLVRSLREPVVLHAYGFGEAKAQAEESAGRTVGKMLGSLAKDPSPTAGSRKISSDETSDPPAIAEENCSNARCSDNA